MTHPPENMVRQIADLTLRLDEAEAACAAKDAFIAALSRELNNPLSPVLLAVEHLRGVLPAAGPARLQTAMRLLERATDGFARRIRVLLDLADLTAGIAPLALTALDVSDLLRQTAARGTQTARLAGCDLRLEVAPDLSALGNAEALHQVLDHVLANAFRFGAGRSVQLAGRSDAAGGALITITDQGPGIDQAKAARLFAPSAQPRMPLEPGLGIGLWVSAQLVMAMGGSIGVDSEPGHGAHVHVRLAAAKPTPIA